MHDPNERPLEFAKRRLSEGSALNALREDVRGVAEELRHVVASGWPLDDPRGAAGVIRRLADKLDAAAEGDGDG